MKNNFSDLISHHEGIEQDNSWLEFVNEIQNGKQIPFGEQLETYYKIYRKQKVEDGPPKVWIPGENEKTSSNMCCNTNCCIATLRTERS